MMRVSDFINQNSNLGKHILNIIDELYNRKILHSLSLTGIEKKIDSTYVTNFIFGITNSCNLRCKSCYNSYISPLKDEMSINDIYSMIDQILPFLKDGFSISGGEPFTKKNYLFKTIDYIRKKNKIIKIGIVTNGTLINEEDVLKLSKYENLTIQISLDGINKSTHEYNRGENTYEKVINNIKLLRKNNVNVLLGILLTEKSILEIEDILKFALENKISNVRFIEMFWKGKSRSKNLKHISSSELIPIYKKILNKNKEYKYLLQKDSVTLTIKSLINPIKKECCSVKNNSLYIDSNGDIYPCNLLINEKFKYGNIKTDRLKNILETHKINEFRKLHVNCFSRCKNCDIKFICGGGCRGTAFEAYSDINAEIPDCNERKQNILNYIWDFGEIDNLYNTLI